MASQIYTHESRFTSIVLTCPHANSREETAVGVCFIFVAAPCDVSPSGVEDESIGGENGGKRFMVEKKFKITSLHARLKSEKESTCT